MKRKMNTEIENDNDTENIVNETNINNKTKVQDINNKSRPKAKFVLSKKKTPKNEKKDNMDEDSDMDSNINSEDEDVGNDELSSEDEENPAKNSVFEGRNIALASAMSRILNTELKEEKPILAKAKEIEQKIEDEKLEYKARKALAAEKKKLEAKDHVTPDYTTLEYEKKLRKIATRGVVKLFNAIKSAQEKSSEVHTLETNKKMKTEVAKKSFMDMIKESTSTAPFVTNTNKKRKTTNDDDENKTNEEEKSTQKPAWKVFHDDYNMNAQMKDWDNDNEDEKEDYNEEIVEEDFENDFSDGD